MKAEELMIGDWVGIEYYATGVAIDGVVKAEKKIRPCKIVRIEDYMVTVDRLDGKVQDCLVTDLIPIPLTAEILEQNGFELREGCTSAWDWNHGEQSVHISGNHTCPIGQTVTIYTSGGCAGAAFSSHRTLSDHRIRGVHELQHALRLCGIEKEIEL